MKRTLFALLILLSISCERNQMDPVVDTLRVEPLLPNDEREVDLIVQLHRHYTQSDKSKQFYEVIAKKSGQIVNYWPEKRLLTVCSDPGSFWYGQFKEIDAAKIKWIADKELTFSQYRDSLTVNKPIEYPNTNGNP